MFWATFRQPLPSPPSPPTKIYFIKRLLYIYYYIFCNIFLGGAHTVLGTPYYIRKHIKIKKIKLKSFPPHRGGSDVFQGPMHRL